MREPSAIGNFRILRQLGSGGMGTVYEAMNEAIERRVAIKVLRPEYARNPEFVARFFNEARAVNRIEHPSLVQISEYGQAADGTAYIVMEYLRGETLTARLQRFDSQGERQPLPQTLQTAWQLAEALAAAHDKGIVHRDLKPDNVILVPDPVAPCGERAKLLDFGIAKLVQSNQDRTGTMVIMGTPSYMSPEQCRGAGEVNDRTDVYSLGTMLYQMVAGRLPFLGEGSGDLIGQHLHVDPLPLNTLAPGTPPLLVELVHRLLIKDKRARPPMREALADLRKLLDGTAAGLTPEVDSRTAGRSGSIASSATTTVSTLDRSSGEYGSGPRSRPLRRIGALTLGALLASGAVGGKLAWQQRETRRNAETGHANKSAPELPSNDQATSSRPQTVIVPKAEPAATPAPAPPASLGPPAPADKAAPFTAPAKEVRPAVSQLSKSQLAVKQLSSLPVLRKPRPAELTEPPSTKPGKAVVVAKRAVPVDNPHKSEPAKAPHGTQVPAKPKGGPIEYEE